MNQEQNNNSTKDQILNSCNCTTDKLDVQIHNACDCDDNTDNCFCDDCGCTDLSNNKYDTEDYCDCDCLTNPLNVGEKTCDCDCPQNFNIFE